MPPGDKAMKGLLSEHLVFFSIICAVIYDTIFLKILFNYFIGIPKCIGAMTHCTLGSLRNFQFVLQAHHFQNPLGLFLASILL